MLIPLGSGTQYLPFIRRGRICRSGVCLWAIDVSSQGLFCESLSEFGGAFAVQAREVSTEMAGIAQTNGCPNFLYVFEA